MRKVRGRECMEGVSAGERESRTEVALMRHEGRDWKMLLCLAVSALFIL